MSNTIESKGRSVEEAISEALLRTGWRRDEVDVTVLEQPKSGFLGLIGGKPAKVRVERKGGGGERRGRGGRDEGRLDAPRGERRGGGRDRDQRGGRATEARGQENRGQENRGQDNRGPDGRPDKRGGEGRPEAGRGDARSDARGGRDRDQRGGRGRDRDRDQPRQDAGAKSPAAPVEPAADRATAGEEGGRSSSRRRRRRPTHQRDNTPVEAPGVAETPAILAEVVNDAPRVVEPAQPAPMPVAAEIPPALFETEPAPRPAPPPAVVPDDTPSGLEFSMPAIERVKPYDRPVTVPTTELLHTVATDLMLHAGFPCRCEVREGEYDLVKLIVEDRSAQVLVGRYGAAVDAVEHLVEKISSQAAGDRVRMNLDVNNFRRRREEHLVQVARNVVREVRETGEPVHLDPLCARERRIVHLQVMDIPGVATYTVQDGNGKHVVVATEDHVRAAAEAAGDAHLSHEDDAHADDIHGEGAAGGDAGDRA